MRKVILRCQLSPGDVVMLTAAVRDLHACYPGQFATDVRTLCPDLWQNNPYLTPLREDDAEVEVVDCEYPLINECDAVPHHCLHGFIDFLNHKLGLQIRLTAYRGDIHLSRQEKAWHSQVHELTGADTPFWLVAAGGKYDVTVKWWSPERFQRVVDHFKEKILFVQVGQRGHHHPRLKGVLDLRGRTTLRQLIRLVYHAEGVLCPITCLMHLAAAVEQKRHPEGVRAGVIIAGGREPVHWEAYPGHQFIHTIGALPCCADSGCWRDRAVPLGDGDSRDRPERLCVNVHRGLPRCLDLIQVEEVIRCIKLYYDGGNLQYLTSAQWEAARRGIRKTRTNRFEQLPLTSANVRLTCERFIQGLPAYPGRGAGRGIVMSAGGCRYFTNAWVAINLLRQHGCTLPIEVWYLGPQEMNSEMRALLETLGVECIDAMEQRKLHPCRRLGGWELKAYAMLHSRFEEVLFLDADNMAVANPEYLFETAAYRECGAIFWPDLGQLEPTQRVWDWLGLERPAHPEFESGQMLMDKRRCWRALRLALWMNEHSDFFYHYLHGDKETFHLAFRKLNQPFVLVPTPVQSLPGTLCQHDLDGRRLFQHRNSDKWTLFAHNPPVDDFWYEEECRTYLRELQSRWNGRVESNSWRGTLGSGRRAKRAPLIRAGMTSCAGREELCSQTLANLRRTDWGDAAVLVQLDDGQAEDRQARQARNALQLLRRFLSGAGDYLLFLEDDLEFNQHLRGNLLGWPLLRAGNIALASLYNPGLIEQGCDVANHAYFVRPESVFGSQAMLISRKLTAYLAEHWNEVEGMSDIKIARLAGRLKRPVVYHAPSLVQHVGVVSTWGGAFHQAKDFDPQWRAAAAWQTDRAIKTVVDSCKTEALAVV